MVDQVSVFFAREKKPFCLRWYWASAKLNSLLDRAKAWQPRMPVKNLPFGGLIALAGDLIGRESQDHAGILRTADGLRAKRIGRT